MKKWTKLTIIGIVIILLVSIVNYFAKPERRIERFVLKYEGELQQIADAHLNGDLSIKEFKGAEVEQVFPGEHPMLQFSACGFGIAPASVYYGFYYSPNDVPLTYQNAEEELMKEADDKWQWKGEGDNGGVTYKIKDKWYYYKARF